MALAGKVALITGEPLPKSMACMLWACPLSLFCLDFHRLWARSDHPKESYLFMSLLFHAKLMLCLLCAHNIKLMSHETNQGVVSGSSQGIGFGILRGLAAAGADVVMHGLVEPQEFRAKVDGIKNEFGVKVGHSAADVRRPQEIRYFLHPIHPVYQISKSRTPTAYPSWLYCTRPEKMRRDWP